MTDEVGYQRFHLDEIARAFPESAETLLLDTYLTNEESASARVFRCGTASLSSLRGYGKTYLRGFTG